MAETKTKYHCNYCQEDIVGVRVKCAECTDFDLCLQCFASGAEIGNHKHGHKYQLISLILDKAKPHPVIQDKANFTIFQPPNNWKAKEELLLLDAIEQYGFGNWEDIANHTETKTVEEAKEHYNNMYILGNIGRATWSLEVKIKPKDHTCPDGGPLSPSLMSKLPPLELSSQEQQELGYMPNRDDFEREYDNEAESLISNLVVNNDDEDIDIALKLAHVDMYTRRLKERLRRKRIAREFNLVGQFFSSSNKQKSQNSKKKPSKEEREFQEKMRAFAQFHTSSEHEQFFEKLQKEKELKSRIKELMRYRRNGITKLEECEEFEAARYKREKKKESKKKSGSSGSSHRRSSMVSKKQEEKSIDTLPDDIGLGEDDAKEDIKEVDMATLPGYELLSDRERKLCTSIGLKPAKYITLKTVLIKDNLQKRQGIPTKMRYPAGLDKNHRRKIVNFLLVFQETGISDADNLRDVILHRLILFKKGEKKKEEKVFLWKTAPIGQPN